MLANNIYDFVPQVQQLSFLQLVDVKHGSVDSFLR